MSDFAQFAAVRPIPNPKGQTYSRADVAQHNKPNDLWTIIDTAVYDLSKFADLHPGGANVLRDQLVAGKDSTEAFFGLHRSDVLKKYQRLIIGTVSILDTHFVGLFGRTYACYLGRSKTRSPRSSCLKTALSVLYPSQSQRGCRKATTRHTTM